MNKAQFARGLYEEMPALVKTGVLSGDFVGKLKVFLL